MTHDQSVYEISVSNFSTYIHPNFYFLKNPPPFLPVNIQVLNNAAAATAAKSLQSCLTLCDPIDGRPPGSSVPGILQARILEWVAVSFSNACMHAKLHQLCSTLCSPMDSSPPGSSVHGILQARIYHKKSIIKFI